MKRVKKSISIDEEVFERLQKISEDTDVPFSRLVNKALKLFLETDKMETETPLE